jgi:regulator of sigma E protease
MNYIIPFLILITIVVFIHEYGHYYFAKRYGVGVTDFSIGFGNEIFGWYDKSGTRWKVCWIPLGGYVKFFGDRNVFSQLEQQNVLDKYNEEERNKLFILKPLYQRSLIVAAGPLANFILAVIIFSTINMFVGKDFTPAVISEVQINSPAYEAGVQKNDRIISIDNKEIQSILEVSTIIATSTSERIELAVLRNGQEIALYAKPNLVQSKDSLGNQVEKRMIGIKLSPLNNEFIKKPLGPSEAIYYAVEEVWFVSVTSLKYLGNMLIGTADSSQLGGPIRIAKITGQIAEYGGHLMFYFFEKILGRPLKQKTQEGFFRIGLFLLFSLMIFVTLNDLKDIGLF